MQLNCPECGQPIQAEHINIQQMAAVCPACHAVFKFQPQAPKAKHRKVKRPQQLNLTEGHDDRIEMSFRTNFRLDKNENFIAFGILFAMFSLIAIIMLAAFLFEDAPLILPLVFGAASSLTGYLLALTVYNHTHIVMEDDTLRVERKPLPSFIGGRDIDLTDVVRFRCEETAVSIRDNYDTPRFNVYAVNMAGRKQMVVQDVVENYGFFIAQILSEHLHETVQTADDDLLLDERQTRLQDILSDDGGIIGADGEITRVQRDTAQKR